MEDLTTGSLDPRLQSYIWEKSSLVRVAPFSIQSFQNSSREFRTLRKVLGEYGNFPLGVGVGIVKAKSSSDKPSEDEQTAQSSAKRGAKSEANLSSPLV